MTKKERTELLWRFKELPSAGEVADLVEQGVLTKEEARDLLFNDREEYNRETEAKSLKEQIKFQQSIIDKLIEQIARNNNVWHFSQTYTPRYPTTYWLTSNTAGTNLMSINTSSNLVTASAKFIDGTKVDNK